MQGQGGADVRSRSDLHGEVERPGGEEARREEIELAAWRQGRPAARRRDAARWWHATGGRDTGRSLRALVETCLLLVYRGKVEDGGWRRLL